MNFVLLFLVCASATVSVHSYKASVVEYNAQRNDVDTILWNVKNYIDIIDRSDDDIIVFPEYGLTTPDIWSSENVDNSLLKYGMIVPEEYLENTLPLCKRTNVEKALKDLSCAAEAKRTYVVVNFIEKDNYTKTNKDIFYNTNVVFNREGRIIEKYRKINLYNETKLEPGTKIGKFTTDFGVTFGLMTCFDILFNNPATEMLTQNPEITDIILSTAWSSVTPFLTSLSVQAGYAKKNRVNLLAANYNNPSVGNGGSGIYDSRGLTATIYISGQRKTQVVRDAQIVSEKRANTCDSNSLSRSAGSGGGNVLPPPPDSRGVDSVGQLPDIDKYRTHVSAEVKGYTFSALERNQTEFEKKVCDGKFCCEFQATIDKVLGEDGPHYMWAVNNGKHASTCALLQCETSTPASCGVRIPPGPTVSFSNIYVNGKFRKSQYSLPITTKENLNPMFSYSYCASAVDTATEEITMKIIEGRFANITVFGVYGYNNHLHNSGSPVYSNVIQVGVLSILALLKFY